MADWITVPKNRNWDMIPQGTKLTDNKKDYINKSRRKEQETRISVDTDGYIAVPTRIKPNDISSILKKKKVNIS